MMEKLHGENNWEDLLIYSTKEGFYPFYETGHISDLQCPTLYLAGGELDREYWAAISYKQLNPYIHVAIIPLAGHLVHDEQPELYSHTLLKFINSIK